jgi:hypothetical protein
MRFVLAGAGAEWDDPGHTFNRELAMTRLYAVLVVVLFAVNCLAQPLVERVPADAVVYVGWQGAEAMPGEYEQSHLKAVMEASNFQALFEDFLPRAIDRIGQEEPETADRMEVVGTLVAAMWRHPSAFYFSGVDFDGDEPMPRLGVLVEAGEEAEALRAQVAAMLAEAEAPVEAEVRDGVLIVRVGEAQPAERGAGLGESDEFRDALGKVHESPVWAAYVDVERLLAVMDEAVERGDDPEAQERWPAVRDGLGLQGVQRLVWTAGFEGREWASRSFMAAPAPREGLVGALMDSEAVSEEALRAVPQSAVMVYAGRLDAARLLVEVREIIGGIDAEAQQQFDGGLEMIEAMVGLNIQRDLLEALGDEWLMYTAPDVGGAGVFGLVVVNRLRDAERAERSLMQIGQVAERMAMMQRGEGDGPHISLRQIEAEGMTIHHLALPAVAPGWGVRDGNLYVALYPQVVESAGVAAQAEGSILDNEKYQQVMQRLQRQRGSAIGYVDLPATAGDGYQSLLLMSQLYLGMADLFGVETPPMVIPPLHRLLPHLSPMGGVTWVDDEGMHMHQVSPFPGAEMVATQQNMLVAQQAMMIGMLLPSLNRARETANRVKCSSNMRMIGLAAIMYANEHRDRFPDDLGELLRTQDLTIDVFICPSTNTFVPPDVRNAPVEQQAEWVNQNADYVWLGRGRDSSMGADDPLLHEHPGNHGGDGINVMFGDVHVEWVDRFRARQLIEDAEAGRLQ